MFRKSFTPKLGAGLELKAVTKNRRDRECVGWARKCDRGGRDIGCGERQVKQLKRQFDRIDLRWVLHRAASTSTRGSTTRTMRETGARFNHVHRPQPDEFRPGRCADRALRLHFESFLFGCAARVGARTLSPIQVCTGIGLRIVRVASRMVSLPAGGTDAGR